MRKLTLLGVVLVVLGAAALVFGRVGYEETKPALKVGPLQVNVQEEHYTYIPTIAGIAILLAGVALVIIDRRAV